MRLTLHADYALRVLLYAGLKRRELVTAARVWVDRHGRPSDIYRFDCITLVDNKLEHIADAFRPGWR